FGQPVLRIGVRPDDLRPVRPCGRRGGDDRRGGRRGRGDRWGGRRGRGGGHPGVRAAGGGLPGGGGRCRGRGGGWGRLRPLRVRRRGHLQPEGLGLRCVVGGLRGEALGERRLGLAELGRWVVRGRGALDGRLGGGRRRRGGRRLRGTL